MKFEIERKFLIKQLPVDLEKYPVKDIIQGYYLENNQIVRLRQSNNDYFKTIKGSGIKICSEDEEIISSEVFNKLWSKTIGQRLTKMRHLIPLANNLAIELDVFSGVLKGLIMAEVEFTNEEECDAFIPPDWFGQELTADRRYRNYSLATKGLPQD